MDDKITPFPGSERTSVVNSLRQFFGQADDLKQRELTKTRRAFYGMAAFFAVLAIGWGSYVVGSKQTELDMRDEFSTTEARHLNEYNARLLQARDQWATQVEQIQQAAQQRVATVEQKLKQQERESNARIRQLRSENEKFKNYYDAQVPADVPGIIWGDSLRLGAADAAGNR